MVNDTLIELRIMLLNLAAEVNRGRDKDEILTNISKALDKCHELEAKKVA